MIIAQKTYKHKVLLLMKVGLAVFMVVVFLAQNAAGLYEAKDFVYKKLNGTEVQYFLNNLNALPNPDEVESTQGLNLEVLSSQISLHIKNAVESILLQEASQDLLSKTNSPSFTTHQSSVNILLMFSIILGLLAVLFIESQKNISKNAESLRLKKLLSSISPRSPNFN